MKRGKFIVFEGIDGSGTSTHVHRLAEQIENFDKYQDLMRTHEPWKSEEIKRRLKQEEDAYSGVFEMAELYIEDRTRHSRDLILPNLNLGVDVLCSRYKMSTCAYQWAQGMDLYKLLAMHENRALVRPDLTFFLDISPKIAKSRIQMRRSQLEKFEHNRDFVKTLVNRYHALVGLAQSDENIFGKVVMINGRKTIKEVSENVWEIYKEHFKLKP